MTGNRLRDRELAARLILKEAVETVAAMGYDVRANIRQHADQAPVAEFYKGYAEPDFVKVSDGLCDLLYVTLSAANLLADVDIAPANE